MNARVPTPHIDPIMTIAQVRAAVSYSNSQIYRLIEKGFFPDRVRLGPGRVSWRTSDIVEWLESRSKPA